VRPSSRFLGPNGRALPWDDPGTPGVLCFQFTSHTLPSSLPTLSQPTTLPACSFPSPSHPTQRSLLFEFRARQPGSQAGFHLFWVPAARCFYSFPQQECRIPYP
ncbi:unnamed protein product, partial [Closterium sp. NIES-53]